MIIRIYIFTLLLFVAGCGYQFSGATHALPGDISRIKVNLFENLTAEPYLESYITASTNLRLMRQSEVVLVESQEAAEAVLQGQILQYRLAAISYDSLDNIQSYRMTVRVGASLKRLSDGKILWRGEIVRYHDFVTDGTSIIAQEDRESAAQKALSERIAEDLAWQMATGFGGE